MGLLKELEMETYDQYITGKKCLQLLKDPHVKTYTSDIPSIGIVGALDMGQSLYRVSDFAFSLLDIIIKIWQKKLTRSFY